MIIPSINCSDFACAKERIQTAEKFLPDAEGWIHVDVEDGKFTKHKTWGNTEELSSLDIRLNVEIHLMVENPGGVIEKWLIAGAKRVIVHYQSIKDVDYILEICRKYGAEAVVSFDPSVMVEDAGMDLEKFSYFQILTVFPGPSGQKPEEGWIEKIKTLRGMVPTATIEVDGGVNSENSRDILDAGADILVSGSYIFGSGNPETAYRELSSI